jgi:hypothetical protein
VECRPAAPDRVTALGAAAALLWLVFCVAWFDAGAQWRPPALAALPRLWWLVPALAAALVWLRGRWATLRGEPLPAGEWRALLFMLLLAFLFRLPVVVGGAGVAVTADGALSGIVALHARDGIERLVFVPHVPYSGSLKSHLTAPLALVLDPAVAFALVSVLFYLVYVAGLFRLARLVARPGAAVLAALYAAFSPAFVTRYSLSNDGNYVEVLAFSVWALWLAARAAAEDAARPRLAFAAGLLLGLGFWCHILAIIPLFAVAVFLVLVARLGAWRPLLALAAGWAIGYAPGWLWNGANGWESFQYLIPGEARTDAAEAGLAAVTSGLGEKLWLMVTDHWPVLMGYDTGYGVLVDRTLHGLAWVGVAAALFAGASTTRRAWRERAWGPALLVLFAATNVAIALVALPHVAGNPRYILFLMCVVPVMLADTFGATVRRRVVLFVLIATGTVASVAQVPGTLRADVRWRRFVADMEREGVRYCYTDFFLATRVNFLSGERIICSAKLGPTTTEYFFSYRERVERAPDAAFIAVNRTSAGKLGDRLAQLGVGFERLDLMKPVLTRLSRKVDPAELFPGHEFPLR